MISMQDVRELEPIKSQIQILRKTLSDCALILDELKEKLNGFYQIDALKIDVELPCGNVTHLNPKVGWKINRGDECIIFVENRKNGMRQQVYSTNGYED